MKNLNDIYDAFEDVSTPEEVKLAWQELDELDAATRGRIVNDVETIFAANLIDIADAKAAQWPTLRADLNRAPPTAEMRESLQRYQSYLDLATRLKAEKGEDTDDFIDLVAREAAALGPDERETLSGTLGAMVNAYNEYTGADAEGLIDEMSSGGADVLDPDALEGEMEDRIYAAIAESKTAEALEAVWQQMNELDYGDRNRVVATVEAAFIQDIMPRAGGYVSEGWEDLRSDFTNAAFPPSMLDVLQWSMEMATLITEAKGEDAHPFIQQLSAEAKRMTAVQWQNAPRHIDAMVRAYKAANGLADISLAEEAAPETVETAAPPQAASLKRGTFKL